jgi:hypothetical protein
MAVIKPGELFHWFTLEGRFFRLLPGHDSEWHGEGVHVVTSGVGAAGRNFEIGERNREEMERLYPPDVYAEDDEMHRVRLELAWRCCSAAFLYAHSHVLRARQ